MKRFFAMMLAMTMMGTTAYAAEEREMEKAIPQWQEVVFDGHSEMMQCYNIDGYTYFRLRDVAEQVTDHIVRANYHFNVFYDNEKKCINIVKVMDYEPTKEIY